METAVNNEERIAEVQAGEGTEPAATTSARKMFKYSEFIHVGEGAAECEHALDGQCDDIEHFHAWCRLPNPYQHEDIRKKGLAAKARKIREYKDAESDASVVLDEELSQIDDPLFAEQIIDEMLAREWAEDYLQAQADVDEEERFEHILQDREEYNRLEAAEGTLPEDEQTPDYKQLVTLMGDYVDAIRAHLVEIQEPKREALCARPVESLVALVRAKRVEEEADRVFIDTYNSWMWFVGTFKVELHPTLGRPHLAMWDDIGHKDRPAAGTMYGEAPEVIAILKDTFNGLQIQMQKASAGN